MEMAKFLLFVGLLVLAVQCSQTEEQKYLENPSKHYDGSYPHHFITFKRFLDQVKHARYKDYKCSAVRDEEAFTEMKNHILKMYEGVRKVGDVTSFLLDGEYGDCLLIEEQPTVYHLGIKKIAKPPQNSTHTEKGQGSTPGNFSYADSPLKLGLRDKFGNRISSPKGRIPMARLTLEKLTRFSTLQDFFSKPSDSPSRLERRDFTTQEVHVHARGIQEVTNFGGNSWLDLWNPTGDFSISQHWYPGFNGDAPEQTVEGGWVMNRLTYPNSDQSRLFIYYTADGYNKLKCWNLDCTAFVQINHNWYLGGTWDHYSTMDGEQWGFEMQWKLYQGNWWLFLKGPGDYEAVGYYPTSIYNGGQLSKNATVIKFGGEVANYVGGNNFPQMGSGALAEKGWREAAYQNTIFWIARDENDGFGVWANLTASDEGKTSCYTVNVVNWPDGGDWGTYLFFGGPGGDNCPL